LITSQEKISSAISSTTTTSRRANISAALDRASEIATPITACALKERSSPWGVKTRMLALFTGSRDAHAKAAGRLNSRARAAISPRARPSAFSNTTNGLPANLLCVKTSSA